MISDAGWETGEGVIICFPAKWSSASGKNKETRKDRTFTSFCLSIYLMAPRKREGRGAPSARKAEKNRQTGAKVGGVVVLCESPSGRDAARTPKCPRGCTVDSCWTQKGHTGDTLTATYTMRATCLIRSCPMYVYRTSRGVIQILDEVEKNNSRFNVICVATKSFNMAN